MRSTHCLPSYSFGGHDVFDAIPKFTKLYGKSVAIIGGETALSKALPHIRPVLDKAGIKVLDIIHFGGECTFARGKEIAQMASVKDAICAISLHKWHLLQMRTFCLLLVVVRPWIR